MLPKCQRDRGRWGNAVCSIEVNVSVFGQECGTMVKEVIGYIRDILKSPKLVAWLAISSAVVLYLPERFAPEPFLTNFKATYGSYVSVTFIATTSYLLIELVLWLYRNHQKAGRERAAMEMVLSRLQSLSHEEQIIMREFIFQDSRNIKLPLEQRVVAGLVRDGLIQLVQRLTEHCFAGVVGVFRLNPLIEDMLCEELVGLPKRATEAERDAILRQRPSFIHEVIRKEGLWEW
jgi:hypothetical protein